jgi:hypothetical protein
MGTTNMKYSIFNGLFQLKYDTDPETFFGSVIFLWIMSFTMGFHTNEGDHLVVCIGIGPMEFSFTLHRWDKILP